MTLRRLGSWSVCFILSITTFRIWTPGFPVFDAKPVQAASVAVTFTDEPNDRSPETYQGSFLYTSVEEMLSSLHVDVAPEDKVFAFPEPGLGLGSQIRVYRAQAVTIKDGKKTASVRSWGKTVGDVLTENQIEIGDKDVVDPKEDTIIAIGAQPAAITITRVAQVEVKTTESIDYKTVTKDDSSMEKGQTKKDQAGKPGTLQKTYLVTRENGEEVSRVLVKKEVTVQPTDEVIKKGTKIVDYGTGGASWYTGVGSMTAAHRTLPKGTKVRVVNVKTGASVIVTIADRGPFVDGRIIDLSGDAFSQIASKASGVATVRLEKVY